MNLLQTPSSAARTKRAARLATVALLLGGAAVGALAQYKIVGPDGKVTYTDKPPAAAAIQAPSNGTGAANASGGLPYETRQAMARYPVTLYATKGCAACDGARQALRQRGVPFNEFSIATDDDLSAFKSRFNATTFPEILIGSKSINGYSSTDLAGYLDAAGYPAQARLSGYNWPPAMPLAPPGAVRATAAAEANAPATAPSAPLLPPPSKSGIQF